MPIDNPMQIEDTFSQVAGFIEDPDLRDLMKRIGADAKRYNQQAKNERMLSKSVDEVEATEVEDVQEVSETVETETSEPEAVEAQSEQPDNVEQMTSTIIEALRKDREAESESFKAHLTAMTAILKAQQEKIESLEKMVTTEPALDTASLEKMSKAGKAGGFGEPLSDSDPLSKAGPQIDENTSKPDYFSPVMDGE